MILYTVLYYLFYFKDVLNNCFEFKKTKQVNVLLSFPAVPQFQGWLAIVLFLWVCGWRGQCGNSKWIEVACRNAWVCSLAVMEILRRYSSLRTALNYFFFTWQFPAMMELFWEFDVGCLYYIRLIRALLTWERKLVLVCSSCQWIWRLCRD